MRRWMLHDNVSQKGYGNALIGRYGGCFEERYKEVYDDRAYHAKGLDAPARGTATLGVRRGQCMVPKRLANMRRWKCQLSILTLVQRTHALIIGNSQSNKEVHKEKSTPRRSVWGFCYPCASSTHGTLVDSNIQPLRRVVIHLVARVLN